VFARKVEDALAYGAEHLERCFHKVPRSSERVVHVCCGYPDALDAEDYPKAPNAGYLQLAGVLEEIAIDAVSIEDAHRRNDLALLERFARKKVILGVIAIGSSRIEEVEEVRDRLRAALGHIDAHRLLAAPDCGLGLLGRDLARAKLGVLATAAHSL
jgi:5-methyltetrahydropteroyltriglutamate--homocysteine methyltransferase